MTTNEAKLVCKIDAFTPDARAHHQQLTEKLLAARTATIETAAGYEFVFAPSKLSVAELAEWSAAESKCCPFFNFRLDLEQQGQLLRLGLTGPQGVKDFIRAEFQVKGK